MLENHYKTLGVGVKASDKEIRDAYKRLSLRYHPDKNNGDPEATEKFKKIARAYSVIGDREKRAVYDRERMIGFIPYCRNAVQTFIALMYIIVFAISMYVSGASTTEKIISVCALFVLYKLPDILQCAMVKYQKFRDDKENCGDLNHKFDTNYWRKVLDEMLKNRREKSEEQMEPRAGCDGKKEDKVGSMNDGEFRDKEYVFSRDPERKESCVGSKLNVDGAEGFVCGKSSPFSCC